MTSRFLFAYGSLSEGMVHFNKIKDFVLSSQPAKLKAKAYRLKVGFPALINEPTSEVEGQLLEVKGNELLIQLLDQFFGYNQFDHLKSLYLREVVQVQMPDTGEMRECEVYFLNPKKLPAGAIEIQDGNWKQAMTATPVLTEKLSERQRAYILRLGAASGRDIVPINDMTLYRELMNLELIVDKGRRLALSKFGQEVFRYLA